MNALPKPSEFLSPTQKKLAASAVAVIAVTVLAFFIFGLFLLLRGFITYFSSVIWPLAVAAVLALILRPLVEQLQRRLGSSQSFCIVLIYLAAAAVLMSVAVFVVPIAFEQVANLREAMPGFVDKAKALLDERFPAAAQLLEEVRSLSLSDGAGDSLRKAGGLLYETLQGAGTWFTVIASMVTGVLLIPIYLFFFLLINTDLIEKLREQLQFVRDDLREDILFLVDEFVQNIVTFFRGQVLIAFILAILFAIGYTLVGLKFGIILGVTVGLLNLVPFLGTIFALLTTVPMALLQSGGSPALVGWVLLVLGVVQVIQDYVLTPRIMGDRTGLSQIVIIVSIFFWGAALNGILGMILAIPLTSFFVVFWRLMRRKYLARLAGKEEENASETPDAPDAPQEA